MASFLGPVSSQKLNLRFMNHILYREVINNMKEHLWDGNIDCGWEDLEEKVVDTSDRFASDMLEIASHSPFDITKELINKETMDRFTSLSRVLSEQISMGYYYQYETNY